MRLPSWTPCIADADDFDCSDCDVGWGPCPLRTDSSRRHFRATRARIRAGRPDLPTYLSALAESEATNLAIRHLFPLPAAMIREGLSRELQEGLTDADLESILLASDHFIQTSPHMFKASGVARSPAEPSHDHDVDLTSGAQLARLAARSSTLSSEDQRRAFKRLAGLKLGASYPSRDTALRAMDRTIDELAQRVLRREGWSIADAQSAALGDAAVTGTAEGEDELKERHQLLSAIQASAMLASRQPQDLDREATALGAALVIANLRLVLSICERIANGRSMELVDVFQEGAVGLLKAMGSFDPFRGFAFSTYATWWIRQAAQRAVADQDRTIRLPVHMVDTVNRLSRVTRELGIKLSREPTMEEIADAMSSIGLEAVSPDRVHEVQQYSKDAISLDAQLARSGPADYASSLGSRLVDRGIESPEDGAIAASAREALQVALSSIAAKERRVLELRFGLADGRARTLEEVGGHFNLTRERIRQIEAKALTRLRHPSRKRPLEGYLGPARQLDRPRRSSPPSLLKSFSTWDRPPAHEPPQFRDVDPIDVVRGMYVTIGDRVARVCTLGAGYAIATTSGWGLYPNSVDSDDRGPWCRCTRPETSMAHMYAFLGAVPARYPGVPEVGRCCESCLRAVHPSAGAAANARPDPAPGLT